MTLAVAALDPPQQRELEFRSQTLGDDDRVLTGSLALAARLFRARRREIQKKQRTFRQQGLATSSAQVVQHG